MATPCPAIDWQGYFLAMNKEQQESFESALAARNLSLGEYMEVIEHAAMDAYARGDHPRDQDVLVVAAGWLSGYVTRKWKLVSSSRMTQEGETPEAARRFLRGRTIHERIESMKSQPRGS